MVISEKTLTPASWVRVHDAASCSLDTMRVPDRLFAEVLFAAVTVMEAGPVPESGDTCQSLGAVIVQGLFSSTTISNVKLCPAAANDSSEADRVSEVLG